MWNKSKSRLQELATELDQKFCARFSFKVYICCDFFVCSFDLFILITSQKLYLVVINWWDLVRILA